MKIEDVRINGLTNPVGISVDGSVTISWNITGMQADGLMLEQVLIYSDPGCKHQITINKGVTLDEDGEEIAIKTAPRTRYYVKVQAVSTQKEPAESDVAIFETSKMNEPWKAQWITTNDGVIPSGYLKMFELSGADDLYPMAETNDPGEASAADSENGETADHSEASADVDSRVDPSARIVSGRLYVSSASAAEVMLNGTSVGTIPDPQEIGLSTDETGYLTSNVSNLLGDDNLLEILPLDAENPVPVIAELYVRRADGSEAIIVTDDSWQYRTADGGQWKNARVTASDLQPVEVPLGEGDDATAEGIFPAGLQW